jgi:long-chain acyl-CoA synthetase
MDQDLDIRAERDRFSPLSILAGQNILIIGTTGFLAKVMLSMLLERFSTGKIFCLIRSQRSRSAEDRFFEDVMGSEMMAPFRQKLGVSFETYIKEKVVVLAGDISKPQLGLTDEDADLIRREVDVVINSAGLVNFNPPLDDAIKVNTRGALELAKFVATCDRPRLVHISTCFVAGNRSGLIREDDKVLGYFPKQAEMPEAKFDWARELRDLDRLIEQIESRTDDGALEAKFKEEAMERLKKEGRELHARTVRAAITNQRRRWAAEELIQAGIDRAEYWGWPNIYTYSKSLGEQAIAGTEGLNWTIVRPAIVESANEYPMPGWNEGMNTTAPLAYMGTHGQLMLPTGDDLILDVVPVDAVASATIAAAAAIISGDYEPVYQVAAGDVNPATMARTVSLLSLYQRRISKRDEESGKIGFWEARIKERLGPVPRTMAQFEKTSSPAMNRFAGRVRKFFDEKEPERYGPFSGLMSQAQRVSRQVESDLTKVVDAIDLFKPFIVENRYVFRTRNTRRMFDAMDEADRFLLPYAVETMDWRKYWLDVHLPGLEKWVFPKMDIGATKKTVLPRGNRDLAEMFYSRTDEHDRRVAFRILREDDVADSFTYRDVRDAAISVAIFLQAKGIGRGDRVMLLSQSRPEWGMAYFGILLSGATAIPLDVELTPEEISNLVTVSQAKGMIASDKCRAELSETKIATEQWSFEDVFSQAHSEELVSNFKPIKRKPEDVASILFTSGTTGQSKGVMLTDRNFTALTSRISSIFNLHRADSLLSVLPLHHTFEFSAGFLLPFNSGASVTYLEERTAELLRRAFQETPVTAMIGVPALWETLHRKIYSGIEEQGKGAELFVRAVAELNRVVRDHSPWNFGQWVFRPMHNALGGRVRYLISGGAPLDERLYKDFRGLGFSLYEGYGLTEASPVLSVGRPRQKGLSGTVGTPLPGIDVQISEPDADGVGEVIARGPTIMAGYIDNPEATAEAIRDKWLHTGDQGRFDEDGRLHIVGRQKDVIIDTGGKNVYPDEIEVIYTDHDFIKELSVVGIAAVNGTGERVSCLVVPDYERAEELEPGLSRVEIKERLRQHFRDIGSKQTIAKKVKVLHFWEDELPRTSTRKVKRPFVRDVLVKKEKNRRNVERVSSPAQTGHAGWIQQLVAKIAQRNPEEISESQRLVDDLGFDSLMQLELINAVEEEFPTARMGQEDLNSVETVGDVILLIGSNQKRRPDRAVEVGDQDESSIELPAPVAAMGKAVLAWAQRKAYKGLFDIEVDGRGNIPANTNFIIAANHSSHLDTGLISYAMDGLGGEIAALAAKDYFFDDPKKRFYFENFTNLVPMERHGSLKKSLKLAGEVLQQGNSLLIYPEGTRARDGKMTEFKPALAYLCLNERVPILPVFLGGTHEALPVGASIPKERSLYVRIGAPIDPGKMIEHTKEWPRSEAYRYVTDLAEQAVRRLGHLNARGAQEQVEGESFISFESEISIGKQR